MCKRIVVRSDVGSSVAFLLTRPGSHPMNNADRSWARGLTYGLTMPSESAQDVVGRVCQSQASPKIGNTSGTNP